MAEIVAFPMDTVLFCEREPTDQMAKECFLLEEGLELLADYRSIMDIDVRTSVRALIKSMARQSSRLSN